MVDPNDKKKNNKRPHLLDDFENSQSLKRQRLESQRDDRTSGMYGNQSPYQHFKSTPSINKSGSTQQMNLSAQSYNLQSQSPDQIMHQARPIQTTKQTKKMVKTVPFNAPVVDTDITPWGNGCKIDIGGSPNTLEHEVSSMMTSQIFSRSQTNALCIENIDTFIGGQDAQFSVPKLQYCLGLFTPQALSINAGGNRCYKRTSTFKMFKECYQVMTGTNANPDADLSGCWLLDRIQFDRETSDQNFLDQLMQPWTEKLPSYFDYKKQETDNLFYSNSYQGQDKHSFGHSQTYWTLGTRGAYKGMSIQTAQQSTFLKCFPITAGRTQVGKGKPIMQIDYCDIGKLPESLNLDRLSQNGCGNLFLKKATDTKELKKHHIFVGDLVIIPPGVAVQITFNMKCLVMQTPFMPMTDSLIQKINRFDGQPPEFQSPTMRMLAYQRAQDLSRPVGSVNGQYLPQEIKNFQESLLNQLISDWNIVIRAELVKNSEIIKKLRLKESYNNRYQNFFRGSDTSHICFICRCEMMGVSLTQRNQQGRLVHCHPSCVDFDKEDTNEFKVIIFDKIKRPGDVVQGLNVFPSEPLSPPITSLPSISNDEFDNKVNADQLEAGKTELRFFQVPSNAQVAAWINAMGFLIVQPIQKREVNDKNPKWYIEAIQWINGAGDANKQPEQWPNQLNSKCKRDGILNWSAIFKYEFDPFLKLQIVNSRVQCAADNCCEDIKVWDKSSLLKLPGEPELAGQVLKKVSGSIFSTKGIFTAVLDGIEITDPTYKCPIKMHQTLPSTILSLDLNSDTQKNTFSTKFQGIFVLQVHQHIKDQAQFLICKELKVKAHTNRYFQLRSVVLATEDLMNFVTTGYQVGTTKPLLCKWPEGNQEILNISDVMLSSQSGEKVQPIPCYCVYQEVFNQVETKLKDSKGKYRNYLTWTRNLEAGQTLSVTSTPQKQQQLQYEQQQQIAINANIKNISEGIDVLTPQLIRNPNEAAQACTPEGKISINQQKPLDVDYGPFLEQQEEDPSGKKICYLCQQEHLNPYQQIKCHHCNDYGAYYGITCLINLVRQLMYGTAEYYCMHCGQDIFVKNETTSNDSFPKHLLNTFVDLVGIDQGQNKQNSGFLSESIKLLSIYNASEVFKDVKNCDAYFPQTEQAKNAVQKIYPAFHTVMWNSIYNLEFQVYPQVKNHQIYHVVKVGDNTDKLKCTLSQCAKEFVDNDLIIEMKPCKHWIHVDCFRKSLHVQGHMFACPKCNKRLTLPIFVQMTLYLMGQENIHSTQHYQILDYYQLKHLIPIKKSSLDEGQAGDLDLNVTLTNQKPNQVEPEQQQQIDSKTRLSYQVAQKIRDTASLKLTYQQGKSLMTVLTDFDEAFVQRIETAEQRLQQQQAKTDQAISAIQSKHQKLAQYVLKVNADKKLKRDQGDDEVSSDMSFPELKDFDDQFEGYD